MLSAPVGRVVVSRTAVAGADPAFALPMTATGLPKTAPLTKNVTVWVGSCCALAIALLCVATRAVTVTGPPVAAVDTLEETVVDVVAFETVTTSGTVVVLILKLGSPR